MVRYPEPEPGDTRRAQEGDPDAFERIYRRYGPPLRLYLVRQFPLGAPGAEEDAAELCQETMLKAWVALTTPGTAAHADPALKLQGWLYRIATNCCRDAQRKRKLVGLTSWEAHVAGGGTVPVADDDPERDALRAEDAEETEALLAQLHPHWREALELAERDGYTSRELATRLGVTRATVKSRLFRAHARLREVYAAAVCQPQVPALVAYPVGVTRHVKPNRLGERYRASATIDGRTLSLGECATVREAIALRRRWEAEQRVKLQEVA